jgi:hypothetical protein
LKEDLNGNWDDAKLDGQNVGPGVRLGSEVDLDDAISMEKEP